MKTQDQVHSLTFVQIQHFQTYFRQKTLGHLKPNFIWSLHGMLGWKFVEMFQVTWPRWLPGPYMVKTFKNLLLRNLWPWNLLYSIGYSSTTKFVQMMTLGWTWPFLWHCQICFLMLLHGWRPIQHIVMYFQACSNSAYPVHSGEGYRTIGPLVMFFVTTFNTKWKVMVHFNYGDNIMTKPAFALFEYRFRSTCTDSRSDQLQCCSLSRYCNFYSFCIQKAQILSEELWILSRLVWRWSACRR